MSERQDAFAEFKSGLGPEDDSARGPIFRANEAVFVEEILEASTRDLTVELVRRYLALDLPENFRPREDERVDFKRDIPKDLARVVLAFANTFGGIVLIGVDENSGVPTALRGCARGRTDLKTTLANLIRNNIVLPSPDYVIDVIALEDGRDFAIVRVQHGDTAYQHLDGRFYKRIADQCVPARLPEIQALTSPRAHDQLDEHIARVDPQIWIKARNPNDGALARSSTFVRLWVVPLRTVEMRLERRSEQVVEGLLQRAFEPGFEVVARRRQYTEWQRYAEPTDVDERLAVTAAASVCYVGQIVRQGTVFLRPVLDTAQGFCLVAAAVLRLRGYRGKVYFTIELSTLASPIVGEPNFGREVFGVHEIAPSRIEQPEPAVFSVMVDQLAHPHELLADGLVDQLRTERGASIDHEVFSKAVADYFGASSNLEP